MEAIAETEKMFAPVMDTLEKEFEDIVALTWDGIYKIYAHTDLAAAIDSEKHGFQVFLGSSEELLHKAIECYSKSSYLRFLHKVVTEHTKWATNITITQMPSRIKPIIPQQ